ncbi:MAG TPA: protein kinase [Desulfobacteria bacterium]|nr:protein kinase [Desulfobacteria bacterium]
MLNTGDVLDGKYHIIGYIGKGRWGRVLLAENLKIGNRWAVKEINLKSDFRVNLQAEPEILKMLNHRSLPRIIDVIRSDDFLYIVEDYFEGQNLRELTEHRDLCTEDNVITWGRQLCEILIYLHNLKPNPIIYRDMKPGNIIVDSDNNVRLIDFGIAREFRTDQDNDSTFIGTIGYAAPEQYSLGSRADERTDIYGLGVTLYHVVTGINPGKNPQKIVPIREVDSYLSPAMEKLIIKCTRQNPDDRYQSAKELLTALENINLVKRKLSAGFFLTMLGKTLQKPVRKKAPFADKFIGTAVIGIGGTNRGVGCTYISIALASFLSRQNCKVGVVERNQNPAFSALGGEDFCSMPDREYFRKKGIDFYWQNMYNGNTNITKALQGGYDFLVIDLGRLLKAEDMQVDKSTFSSDHRGIDDPEGGARTPSYEEMCRANISILVSGCAEWQLKDLAPCLNDAGVHKWSVLFSIPDRKTFEEIKRQLKINSFNTVFSPDPFSPNSHQDTVFEQIVRGALARKKL